MTDLIASGLTELGLEAACAPTLAKYGELLVEKNRVMNLTAITEPADVARLHMLDCAAVLGSADFAGKKVIDVGTGAGFPGMVLKVCCPSIELTLLDSLRKRVDWLQELTAQLDAPAECMHGRAEEFGRDAAYREQYDIATARAVSDLRMLAELCLPFVKVGGRFLAMKADDSQEEVDAAARAITLLGGRLCRPYVYTVPGTGVRRKVIVIEKTAPTPEKYPRRFAKIQKQPL